MEDYEGTGELYVNSPALAAGQIDSALGQVFTLGVNIRFVQIRLIAALPNPNVNGARPAYVSCGIFGVNGTANPGAVVRASDSQVLAWFAVTPKGQYQIAAEFVNVDVGGANAGATVVGFDLIQQLTPPGRIS